jgi:hypothetical protein
LLTAPRLLHGRYCRCPATGNVLKYRLTAFWNWILAIFVWFYVANSSHSDVAVFLAQVQLRVEVCM